MRYISLLLLLWQISTNSLVWNNTTVLTHSSTDLLVSLLQVSARLKSRCGSLGSYQQCRLPNSFRSLAESSSFPVAKQGFYFLQAVSWERWGGGGVGVVWCLWRQRHLSQSQSQLVQLSHNWTLACVSICHISLPQVEKVPFWRTHMTKLGPSG